MSPGRRAPGLPDAPQGVSRRPAPRAPAPSAPAPHHGRPPAPQRGCPPPAHPTPSTPAPDLTRQPPSAPARPLPGRRLACPLLLPPSSLTTPFRELRSSLRSRWNRSPRSGVRNPPAPLIIAAESQTWAERMGRVASRAHLLLGRRRRTTQPGPWMPQSMEHGPGGQEPCR